uniref:Uncharacterized protein n=1 Tax=viral metagenome TaxID=1070528 RepID=A0A6C0E3V4_9ZZZZ
MAYKFVETDKQDINFDNDLVYTHLLDIKDDANTTFENTNDIKPIKIENKIYYKKNYNVLLIFVIMIIVIVLTWYLFRKTKKTENVLKREYVIMPSLML